MDFNEIKKDIHENAIQHGWWEGERRREEVIALIHSEWSEALEAYRNGEGIYYEDAGNDNKPEGIGVELIDGCIRILDAAAAWDMPVWENNANYDRKLERHWAHLDIVTIICKLHRLTSLVYVEPSSAGDLMCFDTCIGIVWTWIKAQGFDPDKILMAKHEYNKKRPYKHGGKVI